MLKDRSLMIYDDRTPEKQLDYECRTPVNGISALTQEAEGAHLFFLLCTVLVRR